MLYFMQKTLLSSSHISLNLTWKFCWITLWNDLEHILWHHTHLQVFPRIFMLKIFRTTSKYLSVENLKDRVKNILKIWRIYQRNSTMLYVDIARYTGWTFQVFQWKDLWKMFWILQKFFTGWLPVRINLSFWISTNFRQRCRDSCQDPIGLGSQYFQFRPHDKA